MNLSLLLAAILTGFVSSVAGYCSEVTVTGAYWYAVIDGIYPLTSFSCEVSYGYNIWGQAYTSEPNFVYSYYGYWYIGLTICQVAIVARSTTGYSYPFDVPMGYWEEYHNGAWQPSPNLKIYCSRDTLSAGAIAGIVIGCVCGAILIIVIILMICNSVKKKKRNSHQETSPPPQTAVQAAAASNTTVTHVQVPSAVVYPNQAYYPPAGDAWPDYGGYSTIAPPAYQPPYDQQQQQPKNYGV